MLNKTSHLIAEILILKRFPRGGNSSFFYSANNFPKVSLGDLVKVPWRNTSVLGIIVNTTKPSNAHGFNGKIKINPAKILNHNVNFFSKLPNREITLKEIISIKEKKFISRKLISRLKELSQKYLVSWNHFVMAATTLKSVRSRSKISYFKILGKWTQIFRKNFKLDSQNALKINKKALVDNKGFYFVKSDQFLELSGLMQNYIRNEKQILILVPEKIHLIPIAAKYSFLSGSSSKNSPIIISKLFPPFWFQKAWHLTKTLRNSIFVGTRSSVFAPFSNLGLIILEDGHDPSYKQWDMNPRYDVRSILSIVHPDIPKLYVSDTPRIEDFFASPQFLVNKNKSLGVSSVKFPPKNLIPKNPVSQGDEYPGAVYKRLISFSYKKFPKKIIIFNTKSSQKVEKKPKFGNPVFNENLNKEIKKNIRSNKWIFVLANHKGGASYVRCTDCGYVPKCRKCGKTLSSHSQSLFYCYTCNHGEDAYSVCPICSGYSFSFSGLGIEKIREFFEKDKFYQKIPIIFPPTSSALKPLMKYWQELISFSHKPRIIIGYSGYISLLRIIKTSSVLSLIPSFDNFLFAPDFRSEEKIMGRIFNLLSSCEKLIIQTTDPNNNIFEPLSKGAYSAYFPNWLAAREKFFYPPYSQIVKFIVIENDKFAAARKSESIAEKLIKLPEVFEAISSPEPQAVKKRGVYWNVLVKLKKKSSIKQIISQLNEKFLIDLEPENLS